MTRRFAFVTWAGGGNVGPTVVLAEGLAARGQDVEVVGPPELAGRFPSARYTAVASTFGTDVPLPDADVHVVDFMLTATLRRLPAPVALVHTLLESLRRDGGPPHPMAMLGPVEPDLLDRCRLVLVACPALLDGGYDHGNVRYAGPLVEEATAPWSPPPGDAPFVSVSMGTTPGLREEPVLSTVIAALADLDVRAVVNVGDHVDRAALPSAANVEVTGFVPHAAVLPHAALLVTHAGLGSVNAALVAGVPMLCLPLDREQPDNARAVERIGAGRALPRGASVHDVREAVALLAGTPGVHVEPSNRAFEVLLGLA